MDWKKNRLMLAVVALVALSAAVFVTLRGQNDQGDKDAVAALPKVEKDSVDALEMVRPGQPTVKLQKEGDTWKMTEPVAAAADSAAVDTVLDKLSELEVTNVAARRKENHGTLEVDDIKGIKVTAMKGSEVLASLVVGASRSAGTMVREKDKAEVMAVKGSIRYAFDKEVKLFRDRTIVEEEEPKVTDLTITSEKGAFHFVRKDDEWAQADGEKAIEDFAAGKVKGVVSALTRLRAADFAAPEATAESTGLAAPAATAVLTMKPAEEGGQPSTVTIKLGKLHEEGREYYAQREGVDTLYRISKYTAERMLAKPEDFAQKPADPNAAPPPMAPTPGAPPSQLPPEVMRQLQQQLQQQGH